MESNTPQKMDKKLKRKDIKKQGESTKKQLKKKNSIEVEENESDLDDINEGIALQNSTMENSDESQSFDGSESEEEKSLSNIFGASLADESDEDDEDYEDDKKVQTKKEIKMFGGVKSNKSTAFIDDIEDIVTDDSDDKDETDSGDDSDDDIGDDSYEDSSYDEEDEEDEEQVEGEEDEEQGEEEEDEESESEEEANESLDLRVLLGNSIADDDDDDDDFIEPTDNDEDDDISDEEDEESEEEKVEQNNSKNNSGEERSYYLEDLKKDKRTIFVNNLPKNVTKKQIEKLFKKFGKIDTIRLRGKVPKSLNMSKRTAAITNDLHSKLKSIYAFVKFESEESVEKASSLNGKIFEGNYLEVRAAHKSDNDYDPKKAVFIGNLHFNIDINTIRKHFKQCGEIESVRIVQDKDSRVGKGFGYVNFKSKDAVALALELNGTKILNREVRVKPYMEQYKSKEKKHGKRVHPAEDNRSSLHKKSKNNPEVSVEIHSKDNTKKKMMKQKLEKTEINPQEGSKFQGQKADENQKKRKNKLEKKKKLLAEKLMAKPRKPLN
ncbi:hypothetical protein K0M31_016850 [Melipona bicolor]|nr:hypothetical protein K0M31_016850 [Melipona bicolor]